MAVITRRSVLTVIGGAALSAPFISRARAAGTLNIYNWADYIGETTIEDFQNATGISVSLDVYSSAEEMAAKMLAGQTGYDLVFTAGMGLPNLLQAGLYDKLDRSKLTNWGNLDPAILKIVGSWDPGNAHSVPYMWGSVGMAYNIDMVKERIKDPNFESIDLVFNPENAAKLADCGISIVDSPVDILYVLLKRMGRDPAVATEADYRAAAELFKPIRKSIRTFDNATFVNTLASKELCVANSWSGQYASAQALADQAGQKVNLGYFVPETGSPAWVDCMAIPVDAASKDNAHLFLNYMMQPEVIAKCTNYTKYANGNSAATPLVDPAVRENPAVYPDAKVMSRLFAPQPLTNEQEQIITRVWADVKAG